MKGNAVRKQYIKIKKGISAVLAAVMMFSAVPTTVMAEPTFRSEAEAPYSALMLCTDSYLLSAVGHQELGGYACSCFALAYARTITDGVVHYFSEYNVYGNDQYLVSAAWSSGDYYRCVYSQKSELFRDLYEDLLEGRPVLAYVQGRGSIQHYVTVVGFENVTSLDELTEDNFLMIDPIPSPYFTAENLGEVGYQIKNCGGYEPYAEYVLIRPFSNVPKAEIEGATSSNYKYVDVCEYYPSSVMLEIVEPSLPYTLPCAPDTALFYDCVSEERMDYPLAEGETVEGIGLYENTEGEYWYCLTLSDGTEAFLPEECCRMTEKILPVMEGGSFPEVIDGATFLEGVIHTNAVLDGVQAKVYRGDGGEAIIESDYVEVGENSYSMKYSMVDYTLPFQELKKWGNGDYTLAYEVTHTNHYMENGELVISKDTDIIERFFFRYEKKEAQKYTIVFDGNGGICSVWGKTVEDGTVIGELPNAERAGYTFDGWYTAKSGGEQILSSSVVSSDMTLYAHWTSKIHRHNFGASVVHPTCTEKGYISYTCSCGYSFNDNFIDPFGHGFDGGICLRCGAEDPVYEGDEGSLVVFSFGEEEYEGNLISIPLIVNSKTEINSFAVHRFTYDEDLLTFVGFEDYGEIEAKAFLTNFDSELGIITVGLETPQMLNGSICDIVFAVREDAEGNGPGMIKASSIVKLNSEMISSSVREGEISVRTWTVGDINNDGSVSIEDALLLYRNGLLPDMYPVAYKGSTDLNGDGFVDILDTVLLFRYSMLPDIYPIE